MKRFIEGADRNQATLFPEWLDDYVSDDNPVRAIDAFVDALDLSALGFDVVPEARLSSGDDAEDLCLWLPQSGSVLAAPGTPMRSEYRTDLADKLTQAGLQNHYRLP